MSFLDTLKSLGLWQGQGQPQQPQANPYGLDQAAMRQAGLSALGNIGGQIMALSQQMTPDQRARMMAGADWTGGLQNNLYNAAQMKLMGDRQRQAAEEDERAKAARSYVAQTLQSMPDGPERRKAMAYLQLNDLPKAIETLYSQNERKTPDLKTVRIGDKEVTYQWDENAGKWMKFGEGMAFKPDAAPKPNWQLKDGYAINMDDPTQPAVKVEGLPDEPAPGLDPNQQANVANNILDDRRTEMAEPQKVVQFAQSIEDALSSGNATGMRGLATQVLFAKVLDPNSAFMTGEAELQQLAASMKQKAENWWNNMGGKEGSPLPPELALQMRDIARQLARRALTKLDAIDKSTKVRADAFGITDQMLGNPYQLRWNRFADPVVNEAGTSRREPVDPAVLRDINTYGGE